MCFVVLGFGLIGLPGAGDFKIHCRLFGPTSATRFSSEGDVAAWLGALPHPDTAELFRLAHHPLGTQAPERGGGEVRLLVQGAPSVAAASASLHEHVLLAAILIPDAMCLAQSVGMLIRDAR